VSARPYEARHRAPKKATARPRRLAAGLALPTAAAAAVTFGAAGAELAMSSQTVGPGQKSPAGPTQQDADKAAQIGDRADKADQAQAQIQAATALRTNATVQAARSAERKDLAARALEAKRAARAQSWQMPIKNPVRTSGFGLRWGRMHEGEDFAVPVGTDLVSMSTGTVVFAGQDSGFGNLVKIRYWDGTVSYFAHMSRISTTEGQGLEPGQVVGKSGNTGHSTGPHLHLEVHPAGGAPVNPASWLAARNIAP
jgi:murein DD-endopeptidase MepM/ murein hydrolase activator NlpD